MEAMNGERGLLPTDLGLCLPFWGAVLWVADPNNIS